MKKLSRKILSVMLVIAMLVPTGVMTVPANAETEIEGIIEFNGHYYKCVNTAMKWNDAKTYCESLGGHLITISSSEENDLAMNLVPEPWDGVFIGMSDEKAEGVWEWVTGETITFTKWSRGEPNNQFNEDYAGLAPYHGQWNDCGNEKRPFICEWDSIANVPGEHVPDGYDFKEDSYNFCNYSANIAKKYYRTMYEPSVASVVYEKTHKTGGLCFGFAYTTAAIYNGLPQVERWEWSKLFGTENAQSIRDIVNQKDSYGVRVSSSVRMFNDDILLNDSYIKYAYIFQFSSEAAEIYNSTKNDIAGLVNTVESFLSANQVGVAVGFVKSEKAGGGGHEVLAVGMDGKDILIDDPNNIDDYERIIIKDDGSWEFTGYGGYTSDNSTIDYSTNTYRPYQILLTGEKIDAPVSDQNKNECFVEGVEKIDSENMLLIVDSKNYSINNSDYVQVVTAKSGAEELNNSTNMYWIKNIDTAEVFVTDDEGTITVAGDNSILTATVTEESTVSMTINESYINASVMTNTGEKSELTFETVDDEGTVTGITVSGTANSDEVTATETEDGIQVTGLNNITVTYETADGTAETKAEVKDGSTVNITVNDDENTVETDWQCKHPDDNHDGICDSCSEDFTKSCSCSCHSNAFMQFLHKILCFLYRIFGMEQYRYCGCGKAHW